MSQIAAFKLLDREKLDRLRNLCDRQEEEAAAQLALIESDDSLDLPDGNCSGEVYTVLFDYLDMVRNVASDDAGPYETLACFWQQHREPLDFRIFTVDKAREILDALSGALVDSAELAAYLAEDWGESTQFVLDGLHALCNNLKLVDETHHLLYILV